jgi:hypothetical protein
MQVHAAEHKVIHRPANGAKATVAAEPIAAEQLRTALY